MARGTKEYITWTYFAGGGIISESQKPHLPLQPAQVQFSDGNVWVKVRDPALVLGTETAELGEELWH